MLVFWVQTPLSLNDSAVFVNPNNDACGSARPRETHRHKEWHLERRVRDALMQISKSQRGWNVWEVWKWMNCGQWKELYISATKPECCSCASSLQALTIPVLSRAVLYSFKPFIKGVVFSMQRWGITSCAPRKKTLRCGAKEQHRVNNGFICLLVLLCAFGRGCMLIQHYK